MDYAVLKLKTALHPDSRYGGLCFFEGERDIPFAIKRIYFIFHTEEGIRRGFHAHKETRQLLFCPHGEIDILLDDGREQQIVTLDDPSKGLLLSSCLWREMIWKQTDSVLCVAASTCYDEEDYIRDYDDFLRYVGVKDAPAE